MSTSSAERGSEVLDAMERRLRTNGIRAVVMSDLATELGMSTKTLYRLFPSKDALVVAVVDRWADRFLAARRRRLDSDLSSEERVRTAARFLVDRRDRLSDSFWNELESDHPDAWDRYVRMIDDGRKGSMEWMATALRPELNAELARALLTEMVESAVRPETLARTGMDRDAAVDMAVHLWSRGAFVDPEAPPPR